MSKNLNAQLLAGLGRIGLALGKFLYFDSVIDRQHLAVAHESTANRRVSALGKPN
jgi:hypothetical protein